MIGVDGVTDLSTNLHKSNPIALIAATAVNFGYDQTLFMLKVQLPVSRITARFTGPRRKSLFPKATRPGAPCATYCYLDGVGASIGFAGSSSENLDFSI